MKKKIIALTGLPASGKSSVATRLHAVLDSVLLDKDKVRDSLFKTYVDYSDEQNDLCVDLIYQVALYLLRKDEPPAVIIDGRSYSRKYQIDALKNIVVMAQCRLCIIECICSAESARQRLLKDQAVHPAKDRDYAMYLQRRASAEPIQENRLTLDTDSLSVDECAERALAYVADTS
ncbi:MAG: AAA family ATPase [Granulosicoccus sp.]